MLRLNKQEGHEEQFVGYVVGKGGLTTRNIGDKGGPAGPAEKSGTALEDKTPLRFCESKKRPVAFLCLFRGVIMSRHNIQGPLKKLAGSDRSLIAAAAYNPKTSGRNASKISHVQ